MAQHFLTPLTVLLPQEPKTSGGPTERTGGGPTGGTGTQVPLGPAPAGGGSGAPADCMSQLWFLPLFLLVLWLMILRPEQKRKKEAAAMMGALKQGEEVVTIGGLHGIVHSVSEREVVLQVDTIRMTYDKTAIARVVRNDPKPAAKKS
ncbi:MAG: preprotein translocase subunit YajC [Planctomycetes bacterium]|nr:preprotein translocase subunit YajC [Planctomycetota bacterium]